MLGSELYRVHHQAQGRLRRKDVFVLGNVFLEDVVLQGAADFFRRDALLFRHRQIHRPDDSCRAVDGHGSGDLAQGDAVKKGFHIGQRGYGNAALAELPGGPGIVGIVAVEGRQVKGGTEAGLPIIQQKAESRVGFPGQAKAGEHPHRPQTGTIAAGMDAAQIGKLPGQAAVPQIIGVSQILRRINRIDRQLRRSFIGRLAAADRGVIPFPPTAALLPQLRQFLRGKHRYTSGPGIKTGLYPQYAARLLYHSGRGMGK